MLGVLIVRSKPTAGGGVLPIIIMQVPSAFTCCFLDSGKVSCQASNAVHQRLSLPEALFAAIPACSPNINLIKVGICSSSTSTSLEIKPIHIVAHMFD